MTREKWLEFFVPAVVVALLGLLGWLASSVSDIKAGQGEMRLDLSYTKGRLDRIVEQIPTLRQQIAAYQARTPAREAVVTTRPVRRDSSASVAAITTIDMEKRKATTHYVTLSNVEVRFFNAAVAGAVTYSAPSALSFGSVAAMNGDTSTSGRVPAYIDLGSSFMMWSATDSVSVAKLRTLFVIDSTRVRNVTGIQPTWVGVMQQVRISGIYSATPNE